MVEVAAALEEVSVAFGDVQALRGLDLEFPQGRTTVLLGPSGCGKSTVLRLLTGLVVPTAGRVRFGDVLVTPDTVLELRRRIGYVIQDGGLFPHLDARGNVSLLARHLGWDPDRIAARMEILRALVELPEDVFDRFPGELSGGQRQRVSLMRALMLDPEVLLLDEPLGALDPQIRAGLQSELRRIFATLERTVVLVTHDLLEAARLGERVVLLRDGAVVQEGRFEDLVARPAEPFVSAFVAAQRDLPSGPGGAAR